MTKRILEEIVPVTFERRVQRLADHYLNFVEKTTVMYGAATALPEEDAAREYRPFAGFTVWLHALLTK